MKKVDTLILQGKILTVLVETLPEDETKAYVSYFVNGQQVINWENLTELQRSMFTVLADEICQQSSLLKWGY